MEWILGLVVFAVAGVSTYAQDDAKKKDASDKIDAQAVKILERADKATKAVKTVKYHGVMKPTGGLVGRRPFVEYDAVLTGEFNTPSFKFKIDLSVKLAEDGKAKKFTAGSDGETYFLVNHEEKKAYEDIDQQVLGRMGGVILQSFMLEYIHPKPFSDELNGLEIRYRGTEKVGDEPCDKVFVEYRTVGQKATWFYSSKDALPRRVIREFASPMGSAGTDLTVTKLVVDPKIDDKTFLLSLPEGYTKTDDFAP